MTNLIKAFAVVASLAMTGTVLADTITYTGNTETSADGSWFRPTAMFDAIDSDSILYSVQAFTVSSDGMYDIESIQGLDSEGNQFDGFIFVYEISFDPADPLSNGIAADDDGISGVGSSQIDGLALSSGITYYLVTSAFDPMVTTFGSGKGPFTNSISGAGNITLIGSAVPVPAAVWLFLSAVASLGFGRRRRIG